MYDTEREVKTIQSKLEALQELLQDMIDSLQKVDNAQSALNIGILAENIARSRAVNITVSRELGYVEGTLQWLKNCEREYLDDKGDD